MASSTIFKNFTVPVEKKSLLLIANDIASGKYKAEVEEIRALLEQGKTEEAANKKKQLLAFTPSAVFSEKRQWRRAGTRRGSPFRWRAAPRRISG